ncbi:MAG: hypothetical protein FJ276_13990 [Planctomycetes bacterium]|nr:hypothetical protein [Planctomycetota bacterium]
MSDEFNPYREWLQLELGVRRPNYYELLKIEPSETDAATIAAAADHAMARVRGFRPGKRAAEWARLLDELADAKACLVDSSRRAAYDRQLRDAAATGPATRLDDGGAEVAPASKNPDLYPPGMAPPSVASPTRTSVSEPKPVAERTPPVMTPPVKSPGAPRPAPSTGTPVEPQPKAVRKMPAAPAADGPLGTGTLPPSKSTPGSPEVVRLPRRDANAPANTDASLAGPPEGHLLSPPKPVNAHVAPPPRERKSNIPLFVGVAATLVVLTMVMLALALWDREENSERAPSDPSGTSAAPPTRPAGAVPGTPDTAGGSLAPTVGPKTTVDAKPATGPSAAQGLSPAAEPAERARGPAENAGSHSGMSENEPERQPAQPPTDVAADDASEGGDPFETPATADPPDSQQAATDPPPAAAPPAAQMTAALAAARQAIGEHSFRLAADHLDQAESLAATQEHRERVDRLRILAGHAQRFWDAVSQTTRNFQGAEELQLGDGSAIVAVVDAGADWIIVRHSGVNDRFSFPDMPPGLALAIARLTLNASNPDHLILLGAGLAAHKDGKQVYRDEARRYWLQAQSRGADVSRLLALLNDDTDGKSPRNN